MLHKKSSCRIGVTSLHRVSAVVIGVYPLTQPIAFWGGCRMNHHRSRFSDDIATIVVSAQAQLNELYHDHSRLMVTIHTNLATRHIFKGFVHLIHTYADAGLLSPQFRDDTDVQLSKQLDEIEAFFDSNPFKRMQFSLIERWNIIVSVTATIEQVMSVRAVGPRAASLVYLGSSAALTLPCVHR
jgi:hypothetical protein